MKGSHNLAWQRWLRMGILVGVVALGYRTQFSTTKGGMPVQAADHRLDRPSGLSLDPPPDHASPGEPMQFAQVSPPPDDPGWLLQLDLSPQQMGQLRSIQQQNQVDLRQKTQQLQNSRRELRDLLAGDASSERVRDHYRRMQQLSQDVNDQRLEVILGVREVLTLEQRRRMADLLESRNQNLRDQVPRRRFRFRR